MNKIIKFLFGVSLMIASFVSASEVASSAPGTKTTAHKQYEFTLIKLEGGGELKPDSGTIAAGSKICLHFKPYISINFTETNVEFRRIGEAIYIVATPAAYKLIFTIQITKEISAEKLFETIALLLQHIKTKILSETTEKSEQTTDYYFLTFKNSFDQYQKTKTLDDFVLVVKARLEYQNKIGHEFNGIRTYIEQEYLSMKISGGMYHDGDESANITPDLGQNLLNSGLRFMWTDEQQDELRQKNPELFEAMGFGDHW